MGEVKKARKIRVEEQKEIKYNKHKFNAIQCLIVVCVLSLVIVLIFEKAGLLNNYTDEKCFTTDGTVITGYDSSCGTNIKIPSKINGEKITEIGERAFSEMGIKSVEFPGTLKKIGKYSFERNNLTEVIIPDSVTKIYAGAFEQNEITKVVLGKSVNLIGSWSFAWNHLTLVLMPDSVKTINQQAFDSNSLTTVTIGKNVETIEYRAFGQNYSNLLWDPANNKWITKDEGGNRNLSLIINRSGRKFDWYDVLGTNNGFANGPELWLESGIVNTDFGKITIQKAD